MNFIAIVLSVILLFLSNAIFANSCPNQVSVQQTMETQQASNNIKIVRAMFNLFANQKNDVNNFSNYLSKDFVQISDGNKIDYQQFLIHVKSIRSHVNNINFKFEQIIADGDLVATHHIANGTKSDGKQVTTEFFAIFTLKNGKIIKCEEVSRMIEGDSSDKDMSYRH